MSQRLKIIIDLLAYEGGLSNDPQDATKIKKSVEESSITELFRKQEAIADGVTDQSIAIPDAATDYLAIFCDQTITIKLNGSADALTLSPKSAGTKTPVFFQRGTISAITVSNASGNTVNLDLIAINI